MTAAPSFVCRLQLCPTDRAWKAVASLARAAARRARGTGVDEDDLASIGAVVLLETVARFDVTRDQTFDGYILGRVRGAMRDAVRAARTSAAARAGEPGAVAMMSSFAGDASEGIAEPGGVDRIADLVAALPAREARVVRGFDLEGRSMADVARDVRVTTPTGWRIRKRALERMHTALEGRASAPAPVPGTIETCRGGGGTRSEIRTPPSTSSSRKEPRGSASTRSSRGRTS